MGALAGFGLVLRAQPTHLDARLRMGDALLALGEVQRAAEVYAVFAEHAARAGHPLRALVALSVLRTLEPSLGGLLRRVADRYAHGSPYLGRGARVSAEDADAEVPPALAALVDAPPPPRDRLVAQAVALAIDLVGADRYPDRVPPVPLFSLLPPESFGAVLDAMRLVRLRPGATVIRQGDPGDAFYVLARGSVRVDRRTPEGAEHHLATLHDGAIFGEMALLSASPRTATVTTTAPADLLELGREALAAAARELDTLAQALDRFTRDRMVHNVLRTSPLFRPFDEPQRQELFRRFETRHVEAGTEVLVEGDPVDGLWLVLSGEVRVTRDGGDRVLAALGPGEVFGELGVLRGTPASATCTAVGPAALLFLAREYVARLLAGVPAVAAYVEGLAEQRLLDTEAALVAADVELEVDVDLDEGS